MGQHTQFTRTRTAATIEIIPGVIACRDDRGADELYRGTVNGRRDSHLTPRKTATKCFRANCLITLGNRVPVRATELCRCGRRVATAKDSAARNFHSMGGLLAAEGCEGSATRRSEVEPRRVPSCATRKIYRLRSRRPRDYIVRLTRSATPSSPGMPEVIQLCVSMERH